MQNIFYNISQVLGITIIHSLWQGLFIYALLRLLLMLTRAQASSTRYFLSLSSLAVISCWFLYTLINQIHFYDWEAVTPHKLPATTVNDLPVALTQFKSESIRYYYSIEKYLPYITLFYLAGLLFNTIKLIAGRKGINRIKQTMSIDMMLQRQVDNFTGMLNIDQKVRIGLSKMVNVPCMMGYVKPIILLPFALPNYLNVNEIEAIILHELAHVKRNDYLVNLVQQIVSAILFFNPSSWLINRIINEERENCCDDLVLKSATNPKIYANALFKLEQTRENNMRMAMAATGKKYHLLTRIERIMKTKNQIQSIRPALLAVVVLTAGIISAAVLNPEIAQGTISVKIKKTHAISDLLNDTTRKYAGTGKPGTKARAHKYINPTYKSNYSTQGVEDKKMAELNAEIDKLSSVIDRYYNSAEFKKLEKEIEKKSENVSTFYDNPDLKQLNEKLDKLSESFSKASDNPETKKLNEEMEKMSKDIDNYYSSPNYKNLEKSLERSSRLLGKTKYGSADYDKYLTEVNRLSKEVNEYATNSDIKAQTKALSKMGSQLNAYYNSPEYVEQRNHLNKLSDSLVKAYANPAIKEQEKQLRQLSQQMAAYNNSPQIRIEQQKLKVAVERMNAYFNSPAYKQQMKQLSNMHIEVNIRPEFDLKKDTAERIEQPEKPEAPEKKEEPETKNK